MLPAALLQGAHGLALLSMARVGAGWSAAYGTGLLVSRSRSSSSSDSSTAGSGSRNSAPSGFDSASWSAPCAIAFVGVGWGLQIGADLTDLLIVLPSPEAVQALCSGVHVGVGGSAGLAVGPVGRYADASVALGRGGNTQMFSYSCSRGAFVGVGVQSSMIMTRSGANSRFYGHRVSARQLLLDRSVPQPPAASLLYDGLHQLMQKYETRVAPSQHLLSSQQQQQEQVNSQQRQVYQQQQQQQVSQGGSSGSGTAPPATTLSSRLLQETAHLSAAVIAGIQQHLPPALTAALGPQPVGATQTKEAAALCCDGGSSSSSSRPGNPAMFVGQAVNIPSSNAASDRLSADSHLSRSVPALPLRPAPRSFVTRGPASPLLASPAAAAGAAAAAVAHTVAHSLYPQVPTLRYTVPTPAADTCTTDGKQQQQQQLEEVDDPYGCLFD